MQVFKHTICLLGLLCSLTITEGHAANQQPSRPLDIGKALSSSAQYQQANNAYRFGPPTLTVPGGGPGETRRSVMQYDNWTLICDANFKQKKEVCNVSQAVWDKNNRMIFSWSLASSDRGEPFFLLRTAPNVDSKTPIELTLKGSKSPIKVKYIGCDRTVCLAQTAIDKNLLQAIEKEQNIQITYKNLKQDSIHFEAPLQGLKQALSSRS